MLFERGVENFLEFTFYNKQERSKYQVFSY